MAQTRLKFYFAGSIRGGRQDQDLYAQLIAHISSYGQVLTEHVADINLGDQGERLISDEAIYARDLEWLQSCDCMIAEVTTPSLGVGYEIGKAEELNIPILCLFREGQGRRLSAMVNGNPHLNVEVYQEFEDVRDVIAQFILGI